MTTATADTLVPDKTWQAIQPLLPALPRRFGSRPRVDDRAALAGIIWLGRARSMLDQSIRGRDEAAARLTNGIGWLWTVYTGAALAGVVLLDRPLPGRTVGVLVAPALLLVVAYTLATWAALPVEVGLDPRVVEEIR
jgi:hypothetical protein